MTGMASMTLGLAWIAIVMTPTTAYLDFVPGFILCGIGMGFVFAPLATVVLSHMREADHAKASGTNSTLREIGGALGIAVLTAVFTGNGGQFTPTEYTHAAVPALWAGVGALVVATALTFLLPAGRGTGGAGGAADAGGRVSEDDLVPVRVRA